MDYNEKDFPVYRIDELISALWAATQLGYKFCQLIECFDEDDKIRVLSVEAIDGDDKPDLISTEIGEVEEVKE